MKKVIFSLVVILTLASCNKFILVSDISDGKVNRVLDNNGITKIGDSIVLQQHWGATDITSTKIYGKYVGKKPKGFSYNFLFNGDTLTRNVKYSIVVRIK